MEGGEGGGEGVISEKQVMCRDETQEINIRHDLGELLVKCPASIEKDPGNANCWSHPCD